METERERDNVLANLRHEYSKYPPVAQMQARRLETSVPLINSALFHSNSHINQITPQIIHILPFLW